MADRSPDLQHILDQIDIVSHIQRDEPLKQEGNRFSGNHGHADSKGGRCLMVYPDTQSFHCWHCGACGSVFDYEMSRNGADFHTVVETLCEQYQIVRPNWTEEQQEQYKRAHEERSSVGEILMEAFRLYHEAMTDDHRAYCRGRGLSDETIDENLLGYAPDGRWLVERLGKKYKDKDLLLKTGLFFLNKDGTLRDRYQDRYVMPYWYQGKIVFSIGRAIDPKVEAHKKYVKHLTHSDSYPFVSGLAVHHILWGEDGIQQGKPVLVAEGIVDALLAKQELGETYSVISPVTTKISNAQIERIADLAKQKGVSEIIFVNDSERSKAGESGALTTAQKIRKRWESEAKETTDPDSKEWTPQLKIATLPRPPEMDKIDLADYFAQGKVDEVRYWVEAARTLERFEMYVDGNPYRFFFGKEFVPKFLSDEIRSEGEYFINTAGSLYHYANGVYRLVTELKKTMGPEGNIPQKLQRKLGSRSKTAHISEAVKHLGIEVWVKEGQVNQDDGIVNMANGLFDLSTQTLTPHRVDYLGTTQLPVRYNPDAQCPAIDKFIREVVPEDCVGLIYELAGALLLRRAIYRKAFMFTGKKRNGKSTLINLLTAFVGKENVSSVALHELAEDRFAAADLFGKAANMVADLSAKDLESVDGFKKITSGDMIRTQRKYSQSFDFSPYAKLVFSANEIPAPTEKSQAYFDRWIIIPFPNVFEGKNENPFLIDEITTPKELSGLFNRALEGLDRVIEQGAFSQNQTTQKALKQYELESDPIRLFLTNYEARPPAEMVSVKRSEVWGEYKNFCEIGQYRQESQIRFNRRLMEIFPTVVKTRTDKAVGQVAIWQNLRKKDDHADWDEEVDVDFGADS